MAKSIGLQKGATTASSAGSAASLAYRDVTGSGGYAYRQYEDGTVVILTSPRSTSPVTVQTGSPEWIAISKEIGPFPGQVNPQTGQKWTAQDWALVLSTGARTASALIAQGAKKSRKKRGLPDTTLPAAPVPPPSTMPEWLPYAGVGVGLIVLVLALRGGGGSAQAAPQAA